MLIEVACLFILLTGRVAALILSILSVGSWTLAVLGVHLVLIIIPITLFRRPLRSEISSFLSLIGINWFCPYLKKSFFEERIVVYSLNIISNLSLMVLYYIFSPHIHWIKISFTIYIASSTIIGIFILEKCVYGIPEYAKSQKGSIKKAANNLKGNEPSQNVVATVAVEESDGTFSGSRNLSSGKPDIHDVEEGIMAKKREEIISIKDLLANTSLIFEIESNQFSHEQGDLAESNHSGTDNRIMRSNGSFHQVGVPITEADSLESYHSSHSIPSHDVAMQETVEQLNTVMGIQVAMVLQERSSPPGLVTCCTDGALQISTVDGNKPNYENVYDAVSDKKDSTLEPREVTVPNLSTSRECIVNRCNESAATLSSAVSHDYENILSVNVHRANTGIRHWKPYYNIEDHIHDYSTFKDRSLIQDSTLASSLYANVFYVQTFDTKGSSISLPDLSNIKTEIDEKVGTLYSEELVEVESPSKAEITSAPNYETIWYSDDDSRSVSLHPKSEQSSIVTTINSLRTKESLCNLYYSSLSDLSSKYFDSQARVSKREGAHTRVCPPLIPENVDSDSNNIDNENKGNSIKHIARDMMTPVKCVKRAVSLKRTPKSPLLRLMSLSQSSLQERTSKALQIGKRVFLKQRVHVITPKKGSPVTTFVPRIKNGEMLKVDPLILKRRGHLSPKDRLILSEASSLMKELASADKQLLPEATGTKVTETDGKISEEGQHHHSTPENDHHHHSTPENDNHVPQMSILSAISSVASPENCGLGNSGRFKSSSGLGHHPSITKCTNFAANNTRWCSKVDIPFIEELESIPSQV